MDINFKKPEGHTECLICKAEETQLRLIDDHPFLDTYIEDILNRQPLRFPIEVWHGAYLCDECFKSYQRALSKGSLDI